MPYIGSRQQEEKSFHDQAVADIAEVKFPFPTEDKPNWKTYLNEPDQTMGISMNGSQIYPDIVVENTQKNTVALIGEVETESSVNQDEASQWKEYSEAGTLLLYVPKGTEHTAKSLISKNQIDVYGLRTFHYQNQKIVIIDIQL